MIAPAASIGSCITSSEPDVPSIQDSDGMCEAVSIARIRIISGTIARAKALPTL